jgi:RimJ/RimL family protein N-acetyltransferase
MKEFRTERLILRGWRRADIEPLAAMNADPEVMRHIGSCARPAAEALAEARHIVADARGGPYGLWAVEELANAAFHGWAGLFPLEAGPEIEIAYRLPRASWGRGIATEAAARLVAHGFTDLGLDRIIAVTAPENQRSRRVLEKLGLAFQDTRRAYGIDGCLYYVLTRAAWEQRRADRA